MCLVGCRGKGQQKSCSEAENGMWRMHLTAWLPEPETASLPSWLHCQCTPGRNVWPEILDTEHLFVWIAVCFQVTIHGEQIHLSSSPNPSLLAGSAWFPQYRFQVPERHFQDFFAWGPIWSWPMSEAKGKSAGGWRAKSFCLILKRVEKRKHSSP